MDKKEKKAPPPGAFVSVGIDQIDEGRFKKQLDASMLKAYSDLAEYIKATDDQSGKATLTFKIILTKTKGVKDHFTIKTTKAVSIPQPVVESVVKVRNGKLLCQPIGASEHDPDQQAFFDADGKPIGVDAEKDVAGTIGKAANQ